MAESVFGKSLRLHGKSAAVRRTLNPFVESSILSGPTEEPRVDRASALNAARPRIQPDDGSLRAGQPSTHRPHPKSARHVRDADRLAAYWRGAPFTGVAYDLTSNRKLLVPTL